MKPISTSDTNLTYKGPAPGIGDLPCHRVRQGFILSEWDLTKAERIAIGRGARVELGIHTEPIPPVQLSVVQRDGTSSLEYVDEHGPFESITPDELRGPVVSTNDLCGCSPNRISDSSLVRGLKKIRNRVRRG